MATQQIIIFGFTSLLLALGSACAQSHIVEDDYTRTQCISKVELVGPQSSQLNLAGFVELARTNDIPLAGYTVSGSTILYFQFYSDCENKDAHASVLVETYAHLNAIEPIYTISDDQVIPHPNTIDLRGSYWID